MSDESPEQVDNPAVDDLQDLLTDVRDAVDRTPRLDGPFSRLGDDDGAWTGTEAERVLRDRLDPLATELNSALSRLEEVIEETADATPSTTDEPAPSTPEAV